MKLLLTAALFVAITPAGYAQKEVQPLKPVRLSIFKNGSYFIKRSAEVKVTGKSFTIPAPAKALLGTYWVATGKAAPVHSIKIQLDTLKVGQPIGEIGDYLINATGKKVTLVRSGLQAYAITGTLLSYDVDSRLFRLRTADNLITIANVRDFDQLILAGDVAGSKLKDSILPLASITLKEPVASTTVSTLSLQRGIQWHASYLFSIINEREGTLTMKATIVNNDEPFSNTPIDIIIGNPEMFYGKELDPACANFLNNEVFSFRENLAYTLNTAQLSNNAPSLYSWRDSDAGKTEDDNPEDAEGTKSEDLYVYKLGNLDLDKEANLIVPVMSTNLTYEDVYTADLTSESTIVDAVVNVFHKLRLSNMTAAPFTSGPVMVLNQQEIPIAQSQMRYTPVKGTVDINLSKAIDVPIKNTELAMKSEVSNRKKNASEFYSKTTFNGRISIQNLQDKRIVLFINKHLSGKVVSSSDNGSSQLLRVAEDSANSPSTINWKVTIEPGATRELSYIYTAFE